MGIDAFFNVHSYRCYNSDNSKARLPLLHYLDAQKVEFIGTFFKNISLKKKKLRCK